MGFTVRSLVGVFELMVRPRVVPAEDIHTVAASLIAVLRRETAGIDSLYWPRDRVSSRHPGPDLGAHRTRRGAVSPAAQSLGRRGRRGRRGHSTAPGRAAERPFKRPSRAYTARSTARPIHTTRWCPLPAFATPDSKIGERPQARIQLVAQGVAHQVDGHDRQHDAE